MYSLTVIGYMGNNVLPARAGDAIRVFLAAPRADTSKRTVVGTLVAERLLDVAVLLVLFVVVGYGLLGEVGGDSVELIAIVAVVGIAAAAVGWRFIRRNEKVHGALAPLASATLGLRRAHHGLRLLALTLLIWAIETGVWMSTGAAVGFNMDPIEGMYMVALASVFSMIPSGPGLRRHAGRRRRHRRQGARRNRRHRRVVHADVALRDRRPDHDPGSDPAGRPLRRNQEPARRARRGPELTMTEIAEPTTITPDARRPRSRAGGARQEWFADQDKRELAVWGTVLVLGLIVRFIALGERAFHHDESQDAYFSYLFRQTGDYEYNPLLHGPLRFYLTALMYVVFGDSDFTARLAPALMGAAMIPMCWGLRNLLGRGAALVAAIFLAFGPSFLYFSRFAREDIYFASLTLALLIVIWRFIDHPRGTTRR